MKLAIIVAAALISAPAVAQAPTRHFGVMVGGGLSALAFEMDGAAADPGFGTFQGRVGLVFNSYLSVVAEAHIPHTSYEWDSHAMYGTDDFELKSAYSYFVQPRIPIGNGGIYGKYGWFESEMEAFGNTVVSKGPAYGAGVDFDVSYATIAFDFDVYDLDFTASPLGDTGKAASFSMTVQNRF